MLISLHIWNKWQNVCNKLANMHNKWQNLCKKLTNVSNKWHTFGKIWLLRGESKGYKVLTRIRPVVVWPLMSSPAQSFAYFFRVIIKNRFLCHFNCFSYLCHKAGLEFLLLLSSRFHSWLDWSYRDDLLSGLGHFRVGHLTRRRVVVSSFATAYKGQSPKKRGKIRSLNSTPHGADLINLLYFYLIVIKFVIH